MAPQGEPPAEHHQPSTPSGGESFKAPPAQLSAAGMHSRAWWWLALVGVPFTLAALSSGSDASSRPADHPQHLRPKSTAFAGPTATPIPSTPPASTRHLPSTVATPKAAKATPSTPPQPRVVRVEDVPVSEPVTPAPTPTPRKHHHHIPRSVWGHVITDRHGSTRVIVWSPSTTCDNAGHHARQARHHRVQPPTTR